MVGDWYGRGLVWCIMAQVSGCMSLYVHETIDLLTIKG